MPGLVKVFPAPSMVFSVQFYEGFSGGAAWAVYIALLLPGPGAAAAWCALFHFAVN